MNRLFSKLSIVMMSFFLLLGTGIIPVHAEGEDFDAFLESEWRAMMEADYSSMHFSVKDYKKMGLEKPEISLGQIGYDYYANEVKKAQTSLDHLHTFDYESLDERQKVDYQVYETALKENVALNSYPNFHEMFNPYTGIYSNLSTIITEFTFYTQEDIDDYLVLVDDYDRYMDDMWDFTKAQAEQGYFMSDTALDEQLSSMQDFIDKGEENPFIVIFENNVDAFEGLSDDQRADYKQRNRDIVLNQVIPSNQKIKEQLETLRGSRSVEGSIYNYSDGKDYYTALMNMKISSSDSAQEAFDYLSNMCEQSMNYFIELALAYPISETETIDLNTPEEILEYLRSHMEGFPKGPELNYTASYLDPSVANPSVMAYYLTTPVDDLTNNVIRINGESTKDDINTLYYTLAHEGFPGHLYQLTWYYNQDYNVLRHDLSVMGYTEGWAQYVEKVMLNRAPIGRGSQETLAVNTFLSYSMQAAADIAVNALGYDKDQLRTWMSEKISMDNEEALESIYQACVDMPGMILPYGYGIAKFWELREKAESALEEEFDLEEYHLQLLTNGPRSFDIVENDLKNYVESKGKSWPSKFTLFEHEKTEEMKDGFGGLLSFAYKHRVALIIAGIVIIVIVLLLLFLIIRGIFRLIFGKKKKKKAQE